MNPLAIAFVWFALGAIAMWVFLWYALRNHYHIVNDYCGNCGATLLPVIMRTHMFYDVMFCNAGCEKRWIARQATIGDDALDDEDEKGHPCGHG